MNPLEDQQHLFDTYSLNNDFTIKIHNNGIIIVFLNPTHNIQQIKYDDEIKTRLSNLSGKKKHGATTMTSRDSFINVTYKNTDVVVNLKSPFYSKLIEINENQEQAPLLDEIVCIYQPKWEQVQLLKTCLQKKQKEEIFNVEEQKFFDHFVMV